MKCKTFKFLYNVIPLNIFRSYLIKKHFSSCSSCSAELADEVEIEKMIISPGKASRDIDLWPGLKNDIISLNRESRLKARRIPAGIRKWQLGLTGAVLLLMLILVPFILNRFDQDSGIDPETAGIVNREIEVKSLRIENRPVKSYYFQSKDTNKIIVWVQKQNFKK